MTGAELPDEDHFARYVKPSFVDAGKVYGSAFVLRSGETGLSVNWLEYFGGNDRFRQVKEVRRLLRLERSRNGRFATFNVGETKQHVAQGASEAGLSVTPRIVSAPLDPTSEFPADPSHAEFKGLPQAGSEAELVGDLIAKCIQHPLFAGKV